MKDLKIPVMSEEDRQKAWDNLKPGDKLAYIEWETWSGCYRVKEVIVSKITPKGSVRLENGELLKAFYSNYHIITKELIEWSAKVKLEENLMKLLYQADRDKKNFKSNLEYEDAIKLKEILEKTMQIKK